MHEGVCCLLSVVWIVRYLHRGAVEGTEGMRNEYEYEYHQCTLLQPVRDKARMFGTVTVSIRCNESGTARD